MHAFQALLIMTSVWNMYSLPQSLCIRRNKFCRISNSGNVATVLSCRLFGPKPNESKLVRSLPSSGSICSFMCESVHTCHLWSNGVVGRLYPPCTRGSTFSGESYRLFARWKQYQWLPSCSVRGVPIAKTCRQCVQCCVLYLLQDESSLN